jgi:hypothetical protein
MSVDEAVAKRQICGKHGVSRAFGQKLANRAKVDVDQRFALSPRVATACL